MHMYIKRQVCDRKPQKPQTRCLRVAVCTWEPEASVHHVLFTVVI